ncbi:patatin-like protein 3 [Cryptomeria japonica]|uniref:patatin-like protein 3 n=1 Tax=Cryptomeria japonica TaxID=3369 RepID=UPI0027DA9878|nr:patatin-like protein 3 [Cryptomeria japonica]
MPLLDKMDSLPSDPPLEEVNPFIPSPIVGDGVVPDPIPLLFEDNIGESLAVDAPCEEEISINAIGSVQDIPIHLVIDMDNSAEIFLAMVEAALEYRKQNPQDIDLQYLRFVVLSIGTGEVSNEHYDAKTAKKWGMFRWLKPLIDALFKGTADVQKHQIELLWHKVTHSLRIEPRDLNGDLASLDNSSEKNLEGLRKLAEEHLQKPLDKDDFKGFDFNDVQNITYQKALDM